MSQAVVHSETLSAAPILDAVERYRGSIVDLDTSRAISADDFARARESLTMALGLHGLMPGDRVIVALGNGPLFVAALTAILAREGSPLLLHWKTPAAELRRYAERFGARFLISEPGEKAELQGIAASTHEIPFADAWGSCWSVLEGTEENEHGPTLRGVPLHPTSGSTGLPKIALRPGFAALEEARHYAETMSIDSSDTILAIPPMSHAYGYGMCVMVPLLTGANIVSTHRFSVKLMQRAVEEHPITVIPTVPAMLDVLSFGAGVDLRQPRWLLTAGALLPSRAAATFKQKTGITACPLYGTTETGGISVATSADGQDVDGRVGPPMDGVSVDARLPNSADSSDNSDDGDAQLGRLFVRSSSMMAGYLDDQGNITTPMPDGWFETGDLARIDDDGTIHLRGRNSEVINVAGLKVVPCEVEEAIANMPGVREVKVYAAEHRSGTQVVKAAVAIDGTLSAADIRAHCERHLVYYKRPQVVTLVDALPRTATGKINRSQLP